jgi:hypothetical protein
MLGNVALIVFIAGFVLAIAWFVGRVFRKEEGRAAEHFRQALVDTLRTGPLADFDFASFVNQSHIRPSTAKEVAQSVYRAYYRRTLKHEKMPGPQRRKLDALGVALAIETETRRRIERESNTSAYRGELDAALADGVLTDAEFAKLDELRVSLRLTAGDIATATSEPAAKEAYLDHFRERFYEAKQDGHISPTEEHELGAIVRLCGLGDEEVSSYFQQIERIKELERIRQGQLPTISTGRILESGELCHFEGACRFHWATTTARKAVDGSIVLTSNRIIFASPSRSFEFKPARIIDIELYGNGVAIQTSGARGTGDYFIPDPELFEAVLYALVRRQKFIATEKLTSDRTRHIPDNVKHEVWQRDGGECVRCRATDYLEFDHVIPFSKGGANTLKNVQILCRRCNLLKSDRI